MTKIDKYADDELAKMLESYAKAEEVTGGYTQAMIMEKAAARIRELAHLIDARTLDTWGYPHGGTLGVDYPRKTPRRSPSVVGK